mmetsp:Transcript_27757/g.51652  ORF Transcript_27757/g.51652 Transcript_27757/m.51652 type:complete len:370 (+) Transcript_27757:177-1286(+)
MPRGEERVQERQHSLLPGEEKWRRKQCFAHGLSLVLISHRRADVGPVPRTLLPHGPAHSLPDAAPLHAASDQGPVPRDPIDRPLRHHDVLPGRSQRRLRAGRRHGRRRPRDVQLPLPQRRRHIEREESRRDEVQLPAPIGGGRPPGPRGQVRRTALRLVRHGGGERRRRRGVAEDRRRVAEERVGIGNVGGQTRPARGRPRRKRRRFAAVAAATAAAAAVTKRRLGERAPFRPSQQRHRRRSRRRGCPHRRRSRRSHSRPRRPQVALAHGLHQPRRLSVHHGRQRHVRVSRHRPPDRERRRPQLLPGVPARDQGRGAGLRPDQRCPHEGEREAERDGDVQAGRRRRHALEQAPVPRVEGRRRGEPEHHR